MNIYDMIIDTPSLNINTFELLQFNVEDLREFVGKELPSLTNDNFQVSSVDFELIKNAIINYRLTNKLNIVEVRRMETIIYVYLPDGKFIKFQTFGGKNKTHGFLKFISWYIRKEGSIQTHKFNLI